jgi:hypothetical protein
MQDYYVIEVKDLAHGIKRWARVVGYVGFDKESMIKQLMYFREEAKRRGQTTGNEYRLVKVNNKTREEVVIDG